MTLVLGLVTCQEWVILTNKRLDIQCSVRCQQLAIKLISWYTQDIVNKLDQRNTVLAVEFMISIKYKDTIQY